MTVSPEHLLQLFRGGKDTLDIARLPDVMDAFPRITQTEREAQVAKLIAYARDKEQAAAAAVPKMRVLA